MMRVVMALLMTLGITMALLIRNIVDLTFFFVSLTMSLGFLILVMWINPNINKHSVNFSIIFCLIGVVVPAIIVGISTTLVIYAIALCIAGLIIGFLFNFCCTISYDLFISCQILSLAQFVRIG